MWSRTVRAAFIEAPRARFLLHAGDLVNVGDSQIGRLVLEPGWRWSESVKPIAGTDSCMFHHVGYVLSGRMHVRHDDGSELEIAPGDAFVIAPGHDAWTVGDHDCVTVDFTTEDDPRYAAAR